MPLLFEPTDAVEQWFSVVKSINEFDKIQIRGVVENILMPTRRDVCFSGGYYRAGANIESILSLKSVRDFQGIAMIARSLFEIAVDIKLTALSACSEDKIFTFVDLEKLRAARRIVDFKAANPEANIHTQTYQTFITNNEVRIKHEATGHWGNNYVNVTHWSEMKLERRIDKLGAPFPEIYALNYSQLSWFAHAGMTGILNVQEEAFRMLAGVAFTVTTEAYMLILAAVVKHFQIDKANDKITDMMMLAKMLPFTDGATQAEDLKHAMLG